MLKYGNDSVLTPGMAMPHPVRNRPGPATDVDTRCTDQARPAETDEDRAVERAGWTLFASYSAGWGVRIVRGLAGYDGMCRPMEYQGFVFVDGKLAGCCAGRGPDEHVIREALR